MGHDLTQKIMKMYCKRCKAKAHLGEIFRLCKRCADKMKALFQKKGIRTI